MTKDLKIFIMILMLVCTISVAFSEKPEDIKLNSFVNDYADILTIEQENGLSLELKQIFDSGTAEVSIVTIKTLEGMPIEDFSFKVAEGKLGDETKNNGLLILLAVEDRKYRFEVGRGIEPVLNDAKIGRIGRNYIVTNFKTGDYYKGLYESTLSIKSVLINDTASAYFVKEEKKKKNTAILWIFLFFFIVLPLLSAIFRAKQKKNKDDNLFFAAIVASELLRGGGRGGGGFGGGGFGGGSFGGGGGGGGW